MKAIIWKATGALLGNLVSIGLFVLVGGWVESHWGTLGLFALAVFWIISVKVQSLDEIKESLKALDGKIDANQAHIIGRVDQMHEHMHDRLRDIENRV